MTPARLQELLDVLELVAQGYTYARIGKQIGLGVEGVKSRVYALRDELGARTLAETVAVAYDRGLLGGPCRCGAAQ